MVRIGQLLLKTLPWPGPKPGTKGLEPQSAIGDQKTKKNKKNKIAKLTRPGLGLGLLPFTRVVFFGIYGLHWTTSFKNTPQKSCAEGGKKPT